ncbi:Acid-sensing ion channel 3 [Araneus ventricosus]|uniref:Acid-sensing ion channel 3 n=1 Tax=Araneus ventricosus TaxID=182803 RepID=A0A4Y2H2E6_ARAVE|nr:Acid-sensing ion channel 3 [Araneus ventricosus]
MVSSRYGNCITFNKKAKGAEILQTSRTGFGGGLVLDLQLESLQYTAISHTYGVKVVVHDPDEKPCLEEEGFIASPGYETSISLKQTVFRRLPPPYKDKCSNYETEALIKSKSGCIRACLQNKNFAKCGCIDPTFSADTDLDANMTLHSDARKESVRERCNLANKTQSCCLDEVLDSMAGSGPVCECPLPCTSVSYSGLVSRSALAKEMLHLKLNNCRSFDPETLYKEENVRLNIFYSTLEKYVYQQHPRWDGSTLLSYVGNQFALWLGLSMATFFEFVEKIIFLFKNLIYRVSLSVRN